MCFLCETRPTPLRKFLTMPVCLDIVWLQLSSSTCVLVWFLRTNKVQNVRWSCSLNFYFYSTSIGLGLSSCRNLHMFFLLQSVLLFLLVLVSCSQVNFRSVTLTFRKCASLIVAFSVRYHNIGIIICNNTLGYLVYCEYIFQITCLCIV